MTSETLHLPPALDRQVIDKLLASMKKKEPLMEVFDIFEKNALEKIELFKKACGNGLSHVTAGS